MLQGLVNKGKLCVLRSLVDDVQGVRETFRAVRVDILLTFFRYCFDIRHHFDWIGYASYHRAWK